jgi:alpha-ketoglutarate-dependent taurine dioxygenase
MNKAQAPRPLQGNALLREVIAHITRPGRAYFNKWVPGEMMLWDNGRLLHCAPGTPAVMCRETPLKPGLDS